MSIAEELLSKDKTYPTNKRTFAVPANAYARALTQHISSKVLHRLEDLSQKDRFEEIASLTEQLSEIIEPESSPLSLPLARVLYSIDENISLPMSERFSIRAPSLITNDKTAKTNFFKNLKFDLQTADSCSFMVSFIRMSGLQLLLNPLEAFRKRGKKGRILTSVYMNITQPAALRKLLTQEHLETRIYLTDSESFHTKAYLFDRTDSNSSTVIIGSSNISQAALINGEEWNVKVPRTTTSEIYDEAETRFNSLWDSQKTIPLTEQFISEYESHLQSQGETNPKANRKQHFIFKWSGEKPGTTGASVYPNVMQQEALDNLQSFRESGENRAAAIAATGTGKTFLAAFDAYQFNAQRVLFIAHRDELLASAIKTFSQVYGAKTLFGKLTGKEKDTSKPFIFSTIQTLSKNHTLHQFAPDHFDYIVVDEFHHAESETYLKVINYFEPAFLFGMTATPERTDGRDVLKLCNYNIACDIRLRDALGLNLLAPFHYFGVADETINYDKIEKQRNGSYIEKKLVKQLNSGERVDYIITQIQKYGYHGPKLCALGFCVNREHAKSMEGQFQSRGIESLSLSGLSSYTTRQEAIENLQNPDHPLQIIFTVDIFNEGIDIPSANMLLFLRPTESSTIFIQQLGRGLRKVAGKEYVTVLDFIGNYQHSFMVPLAFAGESGRRDFDKDYLRRTIKHEFSDLPGGSYVELDEIAKEKILSKLDSLRLDRVEYLKGLYAQFKKDLGESPEILDFLTAETAPNPKFFFSKFGSLYKTKIRCDDKEGNPAELADNVYLQAVAERLESMLPLKWPYEFTILNCALEQLKVTLNVADIQQELKRHFNLEFPCQKHEYRILSAMKDLAAPVKKQDWSFGVMRDEQFVFDERFTTLIKSKFSRHYISDRIAFGLKLFRRHFKPEAFLANNDRFILYQNYTRSDIQFLSEDKSQRGSWREGVKRVNNQYFLFINLNKDEDTDQHLHYKDYFMDPKTFHWQSQNQTSHASTVGQHFVKHNETGHQIHIFVRKFIKQYNLTLPFTYLGQVDYVHSYGDKPMSIVWKLRHAIPIELYEDLTEK